MKQEQDLMAREPQGRCTVSAAPWRKLLGYIPGQWATSTTITNAGIPSGDAIVYTLGIPPPTDHLRLAKLHFSAAKDERSTLLAVYFL